MDRSSGFGSTPSNYSLYSNSLSLRLPYSVKLATERKSLTHYAKGTQSPCGSYCLYVCGFRFYFTPLPGFFSPFPHGTGSLSLTRLYLALADGPACFRQDSSCLAVLRIPLGFTRISVTGLSPSSAGLSIPFSYPRSCHLMVLQPRSSDRFGLLPFRSPLLRESLLFSFPPAT